MLCGISENMNARGFKPLPENILVGISGALGTKESHSLS